MKFVGFAGYRILLKGLIFSLAVLVGAIILIVSFGIWGGIVGGLFALLSLVIFWFYRHPRRRSNAPDNVIISPADGVVVEITEVEDEYVGEALRLGIFMNVFNVHVNRVISDCRYIRSEYIKGKFIVASRGEAPYINEQMHHYIETAYGKMKIIQIAGLMARRIDCTVKPDDKLKRGDVIGMIQFGSRVDIVLPANAEVLIAMGDKVKAGISEMAVYNG